MIIFGWLLIHLINLLLNNKILSSSERHRLNLHCFWGNYWNSQPFCPWNLMIMHFCDSQLSNGMILLFPPMPVSWNIRFPHCLFISTKSKFWHKFKQMYQFCAVDCTECTNTYNPIIVIFTFTVAIQTREWNSTFSLPFQGNFVQCLEVSKELKSGGFQVQIKIVNAKIF